MTETGFYSQPFMNLEPDLNFSEDYIFNLPPNPMSFGPNSTQIVSRKEMCQVDSRVLIVSGFSSDPPPSNFRIERYTINNTDSPQTITGISTLLTNSKEYLMHNCNTAEGAFFRSKNPEEEFIYLNAADPNNIFIKYEGGVSTNKLIDVGSAFSSFTVGVQSVPGDYGRIFVGDNPTYWEKSPSGGFWDGAPLQFIGDLNPIRDETPGSHFFFMFSVRSFSTISNYRFAVNNWNKDYMHNQIDLMSGVTSNYFETVRVAVDGSTIELLHA